METLDILYVKYVNIIKIIKFLGVPCLDLKNRPQRRREPDFEGCPALVQVIPVEEKAGGWEGDDAPSALVWKHTISRKQARGIY